MTLQLRFGEHWSEGGWAGEGDRVLVALSGGMDSVVLLHLLRFHPPTGGLRVEAAHFDHAMRAGSAGDAAWVRGLCRAWQVPLHEGRAETAPGSEAEARELRYAFLLATRTRTEARLIVTAHHADDQVETILFRALRGTGVAGLAGIPEIRTPGVLRPLLPFFRDELEAHAREARLSWRLDPTNRALGPSRNRLRRRVIPELERIHPGAREGLLRLGRNAARTGEALELLLAPIRERVMVGGGAGEPVLHRDRWLELPVPVQEILLHHLLGETGLPPGEAGTGVALEFMRSGRSGSGIVLAGGIRLQREFDRIRVTRGDGEGGAAPPPDPLEIPDAGSGRGRWGGGDPSSRNRMVMWGREVEAPERAGFEAAALLFPLHLRGWRPGDRINTPAGTRKVKELLREARIPRSERDRTPLLVDGEGRVLWIPGKMRSREALPSDPSTTWFVGVADDGNG